MIRWYEPALLAALVWGIITMMIGPVFVVARISDGNWSNALQYFRCLEYMYPFTALVWTWCAFEADEK